MLVELNNKKEGKGRGGEGEREKRWDNRRGGERRRGKRRYLGVNDNVVCRLCPWSEGMPASARGRGWGKIPPVVAVEIRHYRLVAARQK
jgi:hypothetical protein